MLDQIQALVPHRIARDLTLPGAAVGHLRSDGSPFACMLADLAGFSSLSETLARSGPGGEERIEDALNACFGPTLEAIARNGGDVLHFAGDAVTAMWHTDADFDLAKATERAVGAALECVRLIDSLPPIEGHRLQLRIGVAAGVGSRFDVGGIDNRWHHLAVGAPIQDLLVAAHEAGPGEVLLSPQAAALSMRQVTTEPGPAGHARALWLRTELAPRPDEATVASAHLQQQLRAYAAEEALATLERGGNAAIAELRSVTSLFINLRRLELDRSDVRELTCQGIATAQDVLRRYGGGVHKVTMDEKGVLVVAVFGLPPHSYENNAARGARAAIEVHDRLKKLSIDHGIGVTTGRAWCGLIGNDWRREYTVIATVVNQAARLMQHAVNTVYCDDATTAAAEGWVQFQPVPPIQAKGMAQPLPANRPVRRAATSMRLRTGARLFGTPTLVGRQNEMRHLERMVNDLAFDRRGGIAIVEGEPGMGKSALLATLIDIAGGRSVTVTSGTGDNLDANSPWHAWSEPLQRLLGVDSQASEPERRALVLEHLERIGMLRPDVALLNPVLGLDIAEEGGVAELTGVVRHSRAADYAVELFSVATQGAPTLLVIDDVHWLDGSSWELLDVIQRRCPALLVVLGSRPIEGTVHPTLRRLGDLPGTIRIDMCSLGRADVEEMLRRRFDAAELPAALVDLVVARAEGSPLVVEEMAFALKDSGRIRVEAKVATIAPEALANLRFPSTIQGLITARLDRLPSEELATVKYASVIGRTFQTPVLSGIHPSEPLAATLLDQLQHLQTQRIALKETETSWSFAHVLTREAAYDLLPFHTRQRVHLAVATWYERHLEQFGPATLPLLAWHFGAAGEHVRAIGCLEKAGETALEQGSNREAIHFFVEARKTLDAAPVEAREGVTVARRALWANRLGEARLGLGDLDGAREALTEALMRLGERMPQGALPRTVRLLAEAARQAWHLLSSPSKVRRDVEAEVARAWALMGEICYFRTDIGGWALSSLVAINRAEQAGDVTIAARAYGGLANLVGTLRLRRLMARYLKLARRTTDPAARMAADWADAVYRLTFCDWAGAEQALQSGIATGQSSGAHYELGIGITILGYLQYVRAPVDTALDTFQRGLQSARDRGNLQHESWALTLSVPLRLARGEIDEALAAVNAAGEKLATSDPLSVPVFHGVKAQTLWRLGRHAEALAAADDAVTAFSKAPPAGYIYMPGLVGLIEVAVGERMRAGGDVGRARRLAQATMKVSKGFALLFPFARARQSWFLGQWAAAEGDATAAMRHYGAALVAARRDGLPWEEAKALGELGQA
ncbi:MAG: hypothetical protein EXR79_15165 [Myxococcales bacterium]|nr:hypothetical protein [Myxococcales bacterium]